MCDFSMPVIPATLEVSTGELLSEAWVGKNTRLYK
jgi:hypothetical protein